MQELEAALGKVVAQYGWKGLVGCSITKAVARGLGVHTSSFSAMDREVGAILQSCLPHNKVITLIHTEAAGYAELAYDEEEDFNQVRRFGFGGVRRVEQVELWNRGLNCKDEHQQGCVTPCGWSRATQCPSSVTAQNHAIPRLIRGVDGSSNGDGGSA